MILRMHDRLASVLFSLLLLLFLPACRNTSDAELPATAESVDAAASVTAAVMTAVAQVEPTSVPVTTVPPVAPTTDTPVAATPTAVIPTETVAAATATATDTAVVSLCRTLQGLNFRIGPGLSYDPPIRALPPGTPLTPLAFSPIGHPGGQWIQVQDENTSEVGWVSAGSQFVTCNVDVTALPPAANIPPTPILPPAPSPTPVEVAGLPPHVTNNAPGGTQPDYVEGEVIVSDNFLFRMRVADTRFGNEDGTGVDHVEFFITTEDEDSVYFHRENSAAYCIFAGGEPNCNSWPTRDGRYVWGADGPEVQPGDYRASILVYPQDPAFDGEVWNWDFDFTLNLP